MPFQAAAGVTTLSDLEIDVDKDWKAHGIYNLGDLIPKVDGAYSLGDSATQFDTVYAGLTDNAVTTPKIADGDVTSPKLESDVVYKRHLRTGAVDTSYLTDDAVDPTKLASDVIYKHHLRTGVVDTSYLTDDAATSAKVGPSVNLEFVRSNDNTVAGGITPKVDGAYNLGSSGTKFDTAYANNFPGAGVTEVASGSDLTAKGITYQLDESGFLSVGATTSGGAWHRLYTTPAAFEAIDCEFGRGGAISSPTVPTTVPNTANPNVCPGAMWCVSMIPDGTQVRGFASPQGGPHGSTWDGTYLWNADATAVYVYQLKTDGTQVGGFVPPDSAPEGLTWDGAYLWLTGGNSDYIYQLKTDGTQVAGFASPGPDPRGLAWDGTYIWNQDNDYAGSGYVYQLKPDGTQVSSFGGTNPQASGSGLSWDGAYLWHSMGGGAPYIYQLKTDGTEVGNFASPGPRPVGIAWDGAYLWNSDLDADYIYQIGNARNFDVNYRIFVM